MPENVVTKFLKESPTRLQSLRDTRSSRDDAARDLIESAGFVVELNRGGMGRLYMGYPAPMPATADDITFAQVQRAAADVVKKAQKVADKLNALGFRSCAIRQTDVADVMLSGHHGEVWVGVHLTSRDLTAITNALDL